MFWCFLFKSHFKVSFPAKIAVPHVLNGQYQDEHNTNQNQKKKKKYMPFWNCLSSFEGTYYKKLQEKPLDILFLVAFISFYIRYITFYNF